MQRKIQRRGRRSRRTSATIILIFTQTLPITNKRLVFRLYCSIGSSVCFPLALLVDTRISNLLRDTDCLVHATLTQMSREALVILVSFVLSATPSQPITKLKIGP